MTRYMLDTKMVGHLVKGHPGVVRRVVAARYGVLRAGTEGLGWTMGPLDRLIAAHALGLTAVLVTNDRAFGLVPGLGVADWTLGP